MLKKPIHAFGLFFAHPLAALALAFTLLPAFHVLSDAPVPSEAPTRHDSQLEFSLKLQRPTSSDPSKFTVVNRDEKWTPNETAIVVCDVWDYHHSPNAVARLQQLLPRLDAVLKSARGKGVTIIHAPSDCMAAYQKHPARRRAIAAPHAKDQPADIDSWCSAIPAEEKAAYPIDQSDGGEDDDRSVHAEWAKKLVKMGRNPNMPWQRQNAGITIDSQKDYISDRGDEVWNILNQQKIKNVVLTGVHTNMCVLGRPFGLRQMARNGKNVVLMRDMTDTMYNPARWPYVSHFEGTRRVISHIERFVCPTMTSDQWIGGTPFRFEGDKTLNTDSTPDTKREQRTDHWQLVEIKDATAPGSTRQNTHTPSVKSIFFRCIVRIPSRWFSANTESMESTIGIRIHQQKDTRVWINGVEQKKRISHPDSQVCRVPRSAVTIDDANLLVIQTKGNRTLGAPQIENHIDTFPLAGTWQMKPGTESELTQMPLPAKFGGSSNIVFNAPDPLWTPRVLTRPHDFTTGIEGPACDQAGNVFAVNFAKQGTIGKVTPEGIASLFVTLPEGSIGNGIRFAPDGTFFVADYKKHNILRVDPRNKKISVHAHHPKMNQPNDLALSPDGKTLYASDPNWKEGTGNLWRIDHDGTVTQIAHDMGTTNGIEVSPDGKTLYVNESKQRNVWAFDLSSEGTLSNKRLIRHFDDHGFDGMRCDIKGNLYITRHGNGTVIKMTPKGEILREVPVLGNRPSNLCFGGPDRRTIYVTEVDSQRLIQFRVDQPGRE